MKISFNTQYGIGDTVVWSKFPGEPFVVTTIDVWVHPEMMKKDGKVIMHDNYNIEDMAGNGFQAVPGCELSVAPKTMKVKKVEKVKTADVKKVEKVDEKKDKILQVAIIPHVDRKPSEKITKATKDKKDEIMGIPKKTVKSTTKPAGRPKTQPVKEIIPAPTKSIKTTKNPKK